MDIIKVEHVVVGQFISLDDEVLFYVTTVMESDGDRIKMKLLAVLSGEYVVNNLISIGTPVQLVPTATRQYAVLAAMGELLDAPSIYCRGTGFPMLHYEQSPNLENFLVEHLPTEVQCHGCLGDFFWLDEKSISVTFAIIHGVHYIVGYECGLPSGLYTIHDALSMTVQRLLFHDVLAEMDADLHAALDAVHHLL